MSRTTGSQSSEKYIKFREIRASLPCHLSCGIFSKSSVWLLSESCCGWCVSNKSTGLNLCSVSPASPSVLCHYWDLRRIWRKIFSKNNFPLYFPNHWLLSFSNRSLQPVLREHADDGGMQWLVREWQLPQCGQDLCSACGHLEVRPEVILSKD